MTPSETELSIWTVAWGEHVDLMRTWLFRSLAQPGNIPALLANGYERIHWDIFTAPEDYDRVIDAYFEACEPIPGGVDLNINTELFALHGPGNVTIKAMQAETEMAAIRNTRVLCAPPDEFWGDGSLYNLCAYARGRSFSVAASHLRVSPTLEAELLTRRTISNPELVSLAFEHLAPGTALLLDDVDDNSTYVGGMSIRKIRPKLWTLVNHVPSPRLVYFTDDDRRYWHDADSFGFWDHAWPARLFAWNLGAVEELGSGPSSRLRVIGDSDLFFLVERTIPGKNEEGTTPGMAGNDLYRSRRPHNELCQSFVNVLRGE